MLYTRTPYKLTSFLYHMLPTSPDLIPAVRDRNIAMNWLLKQFPKAFNLGNRQPLKIDILADIESFKRSDTPSTNALQAAIRYYTEWGSYLHALKKGAKRIGLEGDTVGEVSEHSEEVAQSLLTKAQQKCS